MIQDGLLTYPKVNASLQTWTAPSEHLNVILYAILSTILAYQLAAIAFDLLLGLKPPGQTTAADISILLLAEEASIFTLLANLHISPTISHWKFHGFRAPPHESPRCASSLNHPRNPNESVDSELTHVDSKPSSCAHCMCWRSPSRPTTPIVIKLFVVVLLAPFANLLAVFLTVESDKHLTFNDVSFGGVVFGVSSNNHPGAARPGIVNEVCKEYSVALSNNETAISAFYHCARASLSPSTADIQSGTSLIRMSFGMEFDGAEAPREAITVHFDNHNELTTIYMFVDLFVGGGDEDGKETSNWRVKADFHNLEQIEALFRQGTAELLNSCPSNSPDLTKQVTGDGTQWKFEQILSCHRDTLFAADILRENLLMLFTLVDSDSLRVVNSEKEGSDVVDGGDFLFIERRRSFMTLAVLIISTAVLVVVRLVVRAVTKNDIHLGIEMVLKNTLNLQRCDSMLQNERMVDYSDRIYEGITDLEGEGEGRIVGRWDSTGAVRKTDGMDSLVTLESDSNSSLALGSADFVKRPSRRVRV